MNDYYADLGLDAHEPSPRLAARLTAEIDAMPPGADRFYREQCRAVLGDEAKRAIYDARLRDPSAPSWTPEELHQLALAPSAPRGRVATIVGTGTQRIMVSIAAGLAVLLALVIGLAACGGSDTPGAAAPSSSGPRSADDSAASGTSDCTPTENSSAGDAQWSKSRQPGYELVLTQQVPLPDELLGLTDPQVSGNSFIVQYQDMNVGVSITQYQNNELGSTGGETWVATYSPDGGLVSTKDYASGSAQPDSFDLMRKWHSGYFRISPAEGIDIPAAAAGDKPDRAYALTVRPDAFDDTAVWVLLRGGDQLYKGTIYRNAGSAPCQTS